MKVNDVAKIWLDYHTTYSKKNTVRSYEFTKNHFCELFGETDIFDLTSDAILKFLNDLTINNKPYTKRVRFAQLTAFFNFIRNNIDGHGVGPNQPFVFY